MFLLRKNGEISRGATADVQDSLESEEFGKFTDQFEACSEFVEEDVLAYTLDDVDRVSYIL